MRSEKGAGGGSQKEHFFGYEDISGPVHSGVQVSDGFGAPPFHKKTDFVSLAGFFLEMRRKRFFKGWGRVASYFWRRGWAFFEQPPPHSATTVHYSCR